MNDQEYQPKSQILQRFSRYLKLIRNVTILDFRLVDIYFFVNEFSIEEEDNTPVHYDI